MDAGTQSVDAGATRERLEREANDAMREEEQLHKRLHDVGQVRRGAEAALSAMGRPDDDVVPTATPESSHEAELAARLEAAHEHVAEHRSRLDEFERIAASCDAGLAALKERRGAVRAPD